MKFNKDWIFLICEIIVIAIYGICTEFNTGINIAPAAMSIQGINEETLSSIEKMQSYYPFFQDIHAMIFIGFGFLMVFLKTHSWTSVCFNYLIAAWVLQITILLTSFWHKLFDEGFTNKITLDLTSLIVGDFGAGAALISMGAVLGKTDLFQLWVLVTLEIIFYSLNEVLCTKVLYIVDMGGSIIIHVFGAYFGLAATYFFKPKKAILSKNGEGGYTSQTIAMIGTLFLWVYWPSFNGGLASGKSQQRVVVNTILSISTSCISACVISRIYKGKLDMEVVLNATLAGGVSIGGASDMVVTGALSMGIGFLAGCISALGFLYVGPYLKNKINLHDTCGVHNLHGMPGVFGGIVSSISTGCAGYAFNDNPYVSEIFIKVYNGERTFFIQGCYQFAAIIVTITIAIISGIISGYISSRCGDLNEFFIDTEHFHDCHITENSSNEYDSYLNYDVNTPINNDNV
jgi:ammonium transporter Rh